MTYGIFLVVHILVAGLLIAVVLMQTGRGGGLAGAFGGGGGGGQTLFGGRGATTFLTKTTWVLGVAFMVTSLMLALTIGRQGGGPEERSIVRENPIQSPASSLPLEPADTEGRGTYPTTIPLGEDSPGTTGETPVGASEEVPAGSNDDVPSSGGN